MAIERQRVEGDKGNNHGEILRCAQDDSVEDKCDSRSLTTIRKPRGWVRDDKLKTKCELQIPCLRQAGSGS
jgi:hypothetical protein